MFSVTGETKQHYKRPIVKKITKNISAFGISKRDIKSKLKNFTIIPFAIKKVNIIRSYNKFFVSNNYFEINYLIVYETACSGEVLGRFERKLFLFETTV